jgi:transposase
VTNEAKAIAVEALYKAGYSTRQIADKFGWAKSHVARYVTRAGIGRKSWSKENAIR